MWSEIGRKIESGTTGQPLGGERSETGETPALLGPPVDSRARPH